MRFNQCALMAISAAVMVGCGGGSVDSSDLKTDGIHATIRISATQNLTEIDCRLTAGGPNGSDVELNRGEELYATAFGDVKTLQRVPQGFGIYDTYKTKFYTNQPGEEIVISLMRPDDPDAPDSHVTVPPKILINSHNSTDTNRVTLDEDIPLTWEANYSDKIEMIATLSCTHNQATLNYTKHTNRMDTGSYTFTFADILSAQNRAEIHPDSDCTGKMYLGREVEGVLDSHLDGGNIKMVQYSQVEFDVDYVAL